MSYWINIGPDATDDANRRSFVRIMRVMDRRYGPMDESQLADWLEFPCAVGGYENDRIYAFGAFSSPEAAQHPDSMKLVILTRHIGGKEPTDTSNAEAELLMLGWTGISADPDTLDATIDQIIEKGSEWLNVIGLPSHPVSCFRPYAMEFGNVRLLYDRICERAVATPPRGLKMTRRRAVNDGEFWQLALLK